MTGNNTKVLAKNIHERSQGRILPLMEQKGLETWTHAFNQQAKGKRGEHRGHGVKMQTVTEKQPQTPEKMLLSLPPHPLPACRYKTSPIS